MIAEVCGGAPMSDGAKERAVPEKRSKLEACAAYDMYLQDVQQTDGDNA
jgi:hypothetical protein